MGILCSSWSAVSRGSTYRWYLNPLGLESRTCVAQGNCMVSRWGARVCLWAVSNKCFTILTRTGQVHLTNGAHRNPWREVRVRATARFASLPTSSLSMVDQGQQGLRALDLPSLCQVFRTYWWMRLYNGPSPKRHVAYCNSQWIEKLNIGRLKGWKKTMNHGRRNTVEHVDKSTGKKKWHGSKHLKSSQSMP